MLITVSGVVGSGKSTAVDHVCRVLENAGLRARPLRFQWLPCFAWFRPRGARTSPSASAEIVPQRIGYKRKTLTARATLGYIGRMIAFRKFQWSTTPGWDVCDRYFYDNLVHYELRSLQERAYARVLRACMPTPDLAILLVASPAAIAERRPEYSSEYLSSIDIAYMELGRHFPELVAINTEAGQSGLQQIEIMLRGRIERSHARARPAS